MRAAGIETFGGEVQRLELAAPQSPARDEVVIAVRAAGVGNWDEIVRAGGWDVGRQPPLALGVEAAGVVFAVGEEVTSLSPGDEVLSEVVPAPSGESVLVHGAGGVTGGLLVQLAIMRGATVVATAGPGSAGRVRGYGASAVFDYHDPGWAD